MFKVELSDDAGKYYEKAGRSTQERLDKALDAIAKDPFDVQHRNIQPLHGPFKGLWRYRLGNLRIVYQVDAEAGIVWIAAIRPRGEVYKRRASS